MLRTAEHVGLRVRTALGAAVPRPVPFLILKITGACNARCRTCNVSIPGAAPPALTLSAQVAEGAIRQMALHGTLFVGFVGGEPLLHAGLFDMLALCRDLGMRTNLNSHGGLIDERAAAALGAAGLSYLSLSLDSPDPATNDLIRKGVSFASVLEAVRRVRRLSPATRVSLGMTVTRHNVGEMAAMCALAAREGVRYVKFQPFHDNLDQNTGPGDPRGEMALGPGDWPRLSAALRAAHQAAGRFDIITNARMLLSELGPVVRASRTLPCVAGDATVFVAPSGQAGGCPEKVTLRSLHDHSLDELMALEPDVFRLAEACPRLPSCFDTTYGEVSHLLRRNDAGRAIDLFDRAMFYA